MKKLIVASFAFIAMVVVNAYAATCTIKGIRWVYKLENGEATITGVSKSISGAVTIPSKLNGYAVSRIECDALRNCKKIKSVVISDGVKQIGATAFVGCKNMTSVRIAKSVNYIADSAFGGCQKLKSVIFLGNAPEVDMHWFPDELFLDVDDNFVIQVVKGSKGWSGKKSSTALPKKWQGRPIKWMSYKVAFNPNGGKGKMSSQKVTYGKSAKLLKNTFKRSGYTFLGWAKSKTGAVAYKNGASVKNLRSTSGTVTLYAVWAKTKYKVAFYANGGKGKMSAQTFTYGKAAKLKKNAFKRYGYTFRGWAKSKTLAKNGKVAYKNRKAVKNLTKNGKTVKLYAVWKCK